jgi:hypothetical protein
MNDTLTLLECTRCGRLIPETEFNAGSERRPVCLACQQADEDDAWSAWWDAKEHEARDEGRIA